MNEEDRRRHDKSWNDPPLFTYDQLNQASTGAPKVPLHKRYHVAPVAPEMSPGMGRPGMYGQPPAPGYPVQPQSGYPGHQSGGQWQQQQHWQPASTPNAGWTPGAPSQNNQQPNMGGGYGPQSVGQQQPFQSAPPFPLGPAVTPSSPSYLRPSAAPVTSVTGSLPGSIPAPGFAPNIIPPASYAGQGAMNHHPQQQPALPPPVGQQHVYPGHQQQTQQNYYYQQQPAAQMPQGPPQY